MGAVWGCFWAVLAPVGAARGRCASRSPQRPVSVSVPVPVPPPPQRCRTRRARRRRMAAAPSPSRWPASSSATSTRRGSWRGTASSTRCGGERRLRGAGRRGPGRRRGRSELCGGVPLLSPGVQEAPGRPGGPGAGQPHHRDHRQRGRQPGGGRSPPGRGRSAPGTGGAAGSGPCSGGRRAARWAPLTGPLPTGWPSFGYLSESHLIAQPLVHTLSFIINIFTTLCLFWLINVLTFSPTLNSSKPN